MQILIILHIVLAVAMVGIILIQQDKSGGAGGALGGGGASSVFGGGGSASFLAKLTAVIVILFFANGMLLAYLANQNSRGTAQIIAPEATVISAEQAPAPQQAVNEDIPTE